MIAATLTRAATLTTHQRNADVTHLYFFQGLLARARLSGNQECDQVNLCTDLITRRHHIMGENQGEGTSCEQAGIKGFFFSCGIFLLNGLNG